MIEKEQKNKVFIATSLDGYIAGKNNELDWLNSIPNPNKDDMGFVKFMASVDALLMGRNTFEVVAGFEGPWPYPCPVFVWSTSLSAIPEKFQDKAEIVKGSIPQILETIHQKGHHQLYIDGGATIRSLLKEDLIDELIISTIPILLGGGIPLFKDLPKPLKFDHLSSKVFLNQITQNHYQRNRS